MSFKKYLLHKLNSQYLLPSIIGCGLFLTVIIGIIDLNKNTKIYNDYITYQISLFDNKINNITKHSESLLKNLVQKLNDLDEQHRNNLMILDSIFKDSALQHDPSHDDGIYLSSLVLIGKNGKSIIASNQALYNFISYDYTNSPCLEKVKINPHKLIIGEKTRLGNYSKKEIIPLGIAYHDNNGNYLGAICTGIVMEDVNTLLFDESFKIMVKEVHLQPINDSIVTKEDEEQIKIKDIDNSPILTLKNFLSATIRGHNTTILQQITPYPYQLSVTLNNKNIIQQFRKDLIVKAGYIFVVLMLAYMIILYIRAAFMTPLQHVVNTIEKLPIGYRNSKKDQVFSSINKMSAQDIKNTFSPLLADVKEHLEEINHIFDAKIEKDKNQIIEEEKRRQKENLLYVLLLERYFTKENRIGDYFTEDVVLRDILKSMIIQESYERPISFLKEMDSILEYCCNYYDITIVNALDPKTPKDLLLPVHLPTLQQTIVNIVNFILNYERLDQNEKIIVTSQYDAINNKVLGIEISIHLSDEREPKKIAPDSMIFYDNYYPLYTAFVLAKINEQILDIYLRDDYLHFQLMPISESLKNIENPE